jgi:hypothetical protein
MHTPIVSEKSPSLRLPRCHGKVGSGGRPIRALSAAGAAFLALFLSGCVSWLPWAAPPKKACHATFARAPVVIDGKLDEACWQRAVPITNFLVPATYAEPVSKTEARLLWDKDNLYVGFIAWDKDVWGFFEAQDSSTCREDVLEVFLQPDREKKSYYNFEMNVRGAVLDAYNVVPRAGMGGRWKVWNCENLKIATWVRGTLNDWTDEDTCWQLEVAIPFRDLPSLAGRCPQAGDEWMFHLSRYDYSVYLPEGPELSSCAPLSKVSYHWYEDWVPLIFQP